MLEVCGGEEREKLANQSCESPQGTEAPGGCWFGLLQAVRGKLGVECPAASSTTAGRCGCGSTPSNS